MKTNMHTFKYKQVIVIRKDLNMSPAKLGVQVAHGAIESYLMTPDLIGDEWYMEGMRKIVLAANDKKDLEAIMEISNNTAKYIVDFGLTELEPNTITGLVFPIMLAEDVDKFTKHLKLYK